MPLVFPADGAPLAEVSPAPLGTAFPVAPGAMVSALAAPEDVDALPVPAPCAVAIDDADAASINSRDNAALFSPMYHSFRLKMKFDAFLDALPYKTFSR
jgi:hypothetical protein